MSFIDNSEFENKDCKDVLERIINVASNYDIYDFICRLAGLNLLSDNQNKSVLIDTLIQYILVRPRDIYTSKIKMSDKKFKTLIDELNSTFLSASIDPCENTFIQNTGKIKFFRFQRMGCSKSRRLDGTYKRR